MTTTAYSTVLSTTNDVEFRAFVQEYHDSLVTIGLTQTSDTGQINPATVNKPTVNNTVAGYEIWRFNDTIQATSPIFLKIEYGLSSTLNNQPSKVWFTVGTGSDGAGNITGIVMARTESYVPNSAQSLTTPRQSYFSYVPTAGFLGIIYKSQYQTGTPHSSIIIQRTVDNAGSPTNKGCQIYISAPSPTMYSIRFTAPTSSYSLVSGAQCLIPFGITNSITEGGSQQVFLHWAVMPRAEPLMGTCNAILAELPVGTTFSTTLVGSTPHTYISVGNGSNGIGFSTCVGGTISNYTTCMLWE